jgi:uncharacterized membrane protein
MMERNGRRRTLRQVTPPAQTSRFPHAQSHTTSHPDHPGKKNLGILRGIFGLAKPPGSPNRERRMGKLKQVHYGVFRSRLRGDPAWVLRLLGAALVLEVTARIVANYGGYWPPDFNTDFLRGREPHFHGAYRAAFYAHILSGPLALVLGLVLVIDGVRARGPAWHRRLGWAQALNVVLVVAPSGLVMTQHAAAGPVAGLGLATLALATAGSVAMGVRAAMRRQFHTHRRWMWRSFCLLSSAVVLRLIGGLSTVTGFAPAWLDPAANWASWLGPLAVFEVSEAVRTRRPTAPPRH